MLIPETRHCLGMRASIEFPSGRSKDTILYSEALLYVPLCSFHFRIATLNDLISGSYPMQPALKVAVVAFSSVRAGRVLEEGFVGVQGS